MAEEQELERLRTEAFSALGRHIPYEFRADSKRVHDFVDALEATVSRLKEEKEAAERLAAQLAEDFNRRLVTGHGWPPTVYHGTANQHPPDADCKVCKLLDAVLNPTEES